MEFDYNDEFEEEFDKRGFPHKHGKNGTLVFVIGEGAFKIDLDFNPEFFNLFPRVVLSINDENTISFGHGFSCRFIHEQINTENMEDAFNDVQNLINDIEKFSKNFSIQDVNEYTFKEKIGKIFEKNKFYYT